jgi:hypothetical protein
MAATGSPERTVDHRLMRLRQARLIERARPYRERGSAPFHWWLTAAGLRLVGRDTTTRPTVPSVHFLAHTSAVAGVRLALAAADGIEVRAWQREEAAHPPRCRRRHQSITTRPRPTPTRAHGHRRRARQMDVALDRYLAAFETGKLPEDACAARIRGLHDRANQLRARHGTVTDALDRPPRAPTATELDQ